MANVKDKTNLLQERAKSLPVCSGCYLMKDADGRIIYVGKAKNLRSRVSSYFGKSAKTSKTIILVGHIDTFEFIITQTEAEALVLENSLIKKHLPKYNILLKDDKSYPYVVIDQNHDYPRALYLRRFRRGKKIKIFGPFVTGSNISEILRILVKSFGLRDCSDREFKSRTVPCLRYQMQQCSAPCVKKITKEVYNRNLKDAFKLFQGKGAETISILERQMEQYAQAEQFERAMMLRDNTIVLKEFIDHATQKCAELAGRAKSLDVVAYYEGEEEIDLVIYMVRGAILIGHKHFYFPKGEDNLLSEIFNHYLQFEDELPKKIVLPLVQEKVDILSAALEIEGKRYCFIPEKKKKMSLMDLGKTFAFERQKYRQDGQRESRVAHIKLKEILKLDQVPRRIEAVDIAVFQGKSPTASVVCFIDGVPDKSNYRHYHLKELPEGNNDFVMMEELFSRRLKREDLPDLFLVDGGQGQLKMVQAVLNHWNVAVPVVGIAKGRSLQDFKAKEVAKTEERLVIPGRSNSYDLSRFPPLLKLLVQLRDEAHRFCRRLHHRQEQKRIFISWLDQISGIGTKTKIKILEKIDQSKENLAQKSVTELAEYLDISTNLSRKLLNALKTN